MTIFFFILFAFVNGYAIDVFYDEETKTLQPSQVLQWTSTASTDCEEADQRMSISLFDQDVVFDDLVAKIVVSEPIEPSGMYVVEGFVKLELGKDLSGEPEYYLYFEKRCKGFLTSPLIDSIKIKVNLVAGTPPPMPMDPAGPMEPMGPVTLDEIGCPVIKAPELNKDALCAIDLKKFRVDCGDTDTKVAVIPKDGPFVIVSTASFAVNRCPDLTLAISLDYELFVKENIVGLLKKVNVEVPMGIQTYNKDIKLKDGEDLEIGVWPASGIVDVNLLLVKVRVGIAIVLKDMVIQGGSFASKIALRICPATKTCIDIVLVTEDKFKLGGSDVCCVPFTLLCPGEERKQCGIKRVEALRNKGEIPDPEVLLASGLTPIDGESLPPPPTTAPNDNGGGASMRRSQWLALCVVFGLLRGILSF